MTPEGGEDWKVFTGYSGRPKIKGVVRGSTGGGGQKLRNGRRWSQYRLQASEGHLYMFHVKGGRMVYSGRFIDSGSGKGGSGRRQKKAARDVRRFRNTKKNMTERAFSGRKREFG